MAFGNGYVPDWDAISSIATVAAVVVALCLAARDRRRQLIEQLEREARAAQIVSQTVSGIIEVMEDVVSHIEEVNGLIVDAPEANVLYCLDECKAIAAREALFHQLPTAYLDRGELVVSLARRWNAEIETRSQIVGDAQLREIMNWRGSEFTSKLGRLLHDEASRLRVKCYETQENYTYVSMPFPRRVIWRVTAFWRRSKGPLE